MILNNLLVLDDQLVQQFVLINGLYRLVNGKQDGTKTQPLGSIHGGKT
jgi:hypothetical protein